VANALLELAATVEVMGPRPGFDDFLRLFSQIDSFWQRGTYNCLCYQDVLL